MKQSSLGNLLAIDYRTLMTYKGHVGTFEGAWPANRGFDRYFGLIHWASNFCNPVPN